MLRSVQVESGLLAGVPGRQDDVTVFRGIPYAAAPVGNLRWRAPQPPPAWEGVRSAAAFGPMSPQPRTAATEALGLPMSEDCLHLNVWTATPPAGPARPVLVWIYGGGFQEGTAADPLFDGENLARKGVVVVTFNYRLGILGFLATPELSAESGHDASGNYGLLDCIAALRWVQRNIAAFGGDPGRVTVAGQSAGAGTVNFLAMSPLAAGLFHRAIAQSHARYSRDTELRYLATSYRRLPEAEGAGARFVAEHVPGETSPAALRSVPWEELLEAGPGGDLDVETGSEARPPLFRPVVDGWVLPAGYDETYSAGAQNDVAYLAGNNLDEGGAVPEETFPSHRKPRGWRPGAPPTHVTLEAHVAAAHRRFGDLAEEYLRLYPATTDDEAGRAHNAAVRDNARVSTASWGADWLAHATQPVRTYFWTHRSLLPGQEHRRASHASEIPYVFDNLDVQDLPWTEQDRAVARTTSAYWTNFIATGDPNGPELPQWPPFEPGTTRVMELGDHPGTADLAEPERIAFWRRFYATQHPW